MSQFRNILFICYYIVYILFHHISPTTARKYHHYDDLHVPCTFFDTINITDKSVKFTNGSYLYDGILLPPHLVGIYDYVYTDLATRVDVTPHLRGCICQVKPCINLCCPQGTYNEVDDDLCIKDDKYKARTSLLNISMITNQNTTMTVQLFDHFATQLFQPYDDMVIISQNDWFVFENGTMRGYDIEHYENIVYANKIEYCLTFVPEKENDTSYYVIYPAFFKNIYTSYSDLFQWFAALSYIFSIPFLLVTIIVYICIPQLQNNHGKSFICHLVCLFLIYLAPLVLFIEGVSRTVCIFEGYLFYYAYIASFCWLNVISFDLWFNFCGSRGINRSKENKRFLLYSLYAWGLPLIFALIVWCIDKYSNVSDEFKANFELHRCLFKTNGWALIVYSHIPVGLLILINTTFFVMTALKIYKTQREIANVMASKDSTKNLRQQKNEFSIFLRLFILMGIFWLPTIIETFCDAKWKKYFYLFDLFNYAHGFLIFLMFVLNKKVKRLIRQRCPSICCGGSNKLQQNEASIRTTSSVKPNATSTDSNSVDTPLMELKTNH